jgi:hypothetical protein
MSFPPKDRDDLRLSAKNSSMNSNTNNSNNNGMATRFAAVKSARRDTKSQPRVKVYVQNGQLILEMFPSCYFRAFSSRTLTAIHPTEEGQSTMSTPK